GILSPPAGIAVLPLASGLGALQPRSYPLLARIVGLRPLLFCLPSLVLGMVPPVGNLDEQPTVFSIWPRRSRPDLLTRWQACWIKTGPRRNPRSAGRRLRAGRQSDGTGVPRARPATWPGSPAGSRCGAW